MKVFIIEIESGCTDHGNAMVFDSVWSTKEAAEKYAKKFKTSGSYIHAWNFEITETELQGSI